MGWCGLTWQMRNTCRGKVITRGKLIFRFAGFNRQITPNDKEEKLILLLVRNF